MNELKQMPGFKKKKKKDPNRTTNEDFKFKEFKNAIFSSELFLHAYCTLIEHTQNLFPSNQQV